MPRSTFELDDADANRQWTPVRSHGGEIYCSPGCGNRCTYAAYVNATRRAARLAKQLGPGWQPRVWENLGWHYEAVFGDDPEQWVECLRVIPCQYSGAEKTYSAYYGGHYASARTARGAVTAMKAVVQDRHVKSLRHVRVLRNA